MEEIILDFALTNDFKLVNNFYKREKRSITSKSTNSIIQLDYFMIMRK